MCEVMPRSVRRSDPYVPCWDELCCASLRYRSMEWLQFDQCQEIDITCNWNIYNDKFVDGVDVPQADLTVRPRTQGGSIAHS